MLRAVFYPSMAKTRLTFALGVIAGWLVASPAVAQVPLLDPLRRADDLENVGIAIEQDGTIAYPASMMLNAVYSGEVRAAISVDQNGKLTDFLITAYTQPEFAPPALEAIKRWNYQPARANGRKVAARANILFEFRNQGVVVQTLPGAIVRQAFYSSLDKVYNYRPCQLKELDQIPEPVHVVRPNVPPGDQEHVVTVEFYIDEEGRVRMPAVSRESAADVYAAASVAAVEQWRFKPPLHKGKPTLVLAEQKFTFLPKR